MIFPRYIITSIKDISIHVWFALFIINVYCITIYCVCVCVLPLFIFHHRFTRPSSCPYPQSRLIMNFCCWDFSDNYCPLLRNAFVLTIKHVGVGWLGGYDQAYMKCFPSKLNLPITNWVCSIPH